MHIEGWIKDIIEKTILQDWVAVIYTNCNNYNMSSIPVFQFQGVSMFSIYYQFNLLNGLSLSKRSTPGTFHSPETHLKVIWFNFYSSSNLWGTFWNYTYWPHFRSKTRFNNGNQNVLWWSLIWFNVMFNRIMIWYDTRLNLPVSIFIEPSTNSLKIPKNCTETASPHVKVIRNIF